MEFVILLLAVLIVGAIHPDDGHIGRVLVAGAIALIGLIILRLMRSIWRILRNVIG